jgi:hypothetical protein
MNRVISGAKRAVRAIREHFAFSRFLGLRLFAFSLRVRIQRELSWRSGVACQSVNFANRARYRNMM